MTDLKSVINIAVVDDHGLYRSGLVNLIHSLGDEFQVTKQASNGKEFLEILDNSTLPNIVILDIDMPIMNGFETAEILAKKYPGLPVLVITMLEDEASLIRMLRIGVKGFLSKDVEPDELKLALLSISSKGYHYTDLMTGKLIQSLQNDPIPANSENNLSEKEIVFLEYCCTELTYKEIADKMCLSPKTIDGYRGVLFEKLNAKSRVGLVLHVIKNGIVSVF